MTREAAIINATGCRRNLDDMSMALLAHNRQRRLRHVNETKEIGLNRDPEGVHVEVFNRRLCRAGRMDHHVYTAKGIHGGLHCRCRRGRVSYILLYSTDSVPVTVHQFMQPLEVARGGNHVAPADSAASATWRPMPCALPVMSQTLDILFFDLF